MTVLWPPDGESGELAGAIDEEIEDAVHIAKNSAGWSTYLNGMQVDLEKFKSEVREVGSYIKAKRAA